MEVSFRRKVMAAIIIYLIIALLLAGLTAWLGFDLQRRRDSIQTNRRDLTFRSSAVEALSILRQGWQQAQSQRLFLENILPPADRLIDFPRDSQGLAKLNKVDLSFTFGQETAAKEAAPGQISFNLITKGELSNLLNFLRALEQSRYLIEFDAFTLSGDGKDYQAIINGKVFSQ